MRARVLGVAALMLLVGTGTAAADDAHPSLRFAVSFPSSLRQAAADGRVYVVVSRKDTPEPREQIDITGGVPFWGQDVDGLRPGRTTYVDGRAYGYPLERLRDLPSGRYTVQAFFNVYTTFHRADGSTVKMHMPCGDGQDLFNSPGNLYGTPQTIDVAPRHSGTIRLNLDHVITPAQPVPAGGTCQQGNP